MRKSTCSRRTFKPAKTYPEFPLFSHATGRWAKKISGKLHYFGAWSDWEGALRRYQEQRDDLYAGRTPRVHGDGLIVRDLCSRFLTNKRQLRAMILLGINCGLGNSDCTGLSHSHLDPERGWLNYPRVKTGIARGCPLCPETGEALNAGLKDRPRRSCSAREFFCVGISGALKEREIAAPEIDTSTLLFFRAALSYWVRIDSPIRT